MPRVRITTRSLLLICSIIGAFISVGDAAYAQNLHRWQTLDCSTRPGWLGLRIVAAEGGTSSVQRRDWLKNQLEWVDSLFLRLGVRVCVKTITMSKDVPNAVRTRHMRSALAGHIEGPELHVFLTSYLADVDNVGSEIRGVHWRSRRRGKRHRFIILSINAPGFVLAHEIGHFLGLPHSTYPISIMNKSARTEPPVGKRSFADQEYVLLRRGLRRLYRNVKRHRAAKKAKKTSRHRR